MCDNDFRFRSSQHPFAHKGRGGPYPGRALQLRESLACQGVRGNLAEMNYFLFWPACTGAHAYHLSIGSYNAAYVQPLYELVNKKL